MKLSLNSSTDFNAFAPLFGTPETVISSILDLSPLTSKTLLFLDTFSFFILTQDYEQKKYILADRD